MSTHEDAEQHHDAQDHGSPTGDSGHEGHGGHENHQGHGDHAGHFRRLFWIMLALAVPTVALSPSFADLLGYAPPSGTAWIPAVLGTVIYAWGGWPFLSGGLSELRSRAPGMMLLIGMAITVAFLASAGATLGLIPADLEYWWELALLVVIMLLGHWIEMRSLAQTASALDSLASLLPDQAERVGSDGEVETIDPGELAEGDIVVVRPGGRVPADGEVTDGRAHMDESMITGESAPVTRGEGETVVAGTVATDSGLRVRITAVGEQTALAGIQRMVAEAQSTSTQVQRLADRAAAWLFWFALAAALVTAIVWLLTGDPGQALVRVITVLVIACPHALGLAIPLVVSISTERAARAGILVKDRLALERARTVDTVLFDKTGTLTMGEPAVQDITGTDDTDAEAVLRWAAAAEADSEHPLARAIVREAQRRRIRPPQASDFASEPGTGVSATVEDRKVRVGGPGLLEEIGAHPVPQAQEWSARGHTVLHVVLDGTVVGALALADEIRAESRQAVEDLHAEGVSVVMVTGDAQAVADAVAEELGIDQVFAQVRPENKNAKVRELQQQGRVVAMVGDGVNDAPALAEADVGIAIGAGTDVAAASAGVILAGDDPRSVLQVLRLSRTSYRTMVQNLWWASGYNLAAVPLAAGVLAPIGFVMPMAVGALLMSASTVVVALNALRLRRLDLTS
ncbi:heavy metal translocating P-type ATPase [Ruania suaedae]|uniref:heavy metal translocating P-type ATPase n=1 Tax=Ruania suaedae TaxID=2897774 RepID=UPI001E53E3C2|nr:heavy metal translocating P-type ATPase [Ruania suaedae]UFU03995.1 heavy metal translocating P-type ATPase [Ruania suaedae]